jgi:hypothetical protein
MRCLCHVGMSWRRGRESSVLQPLAMRASMAALFLQEKHLGDAAGFKGIIFP